MVQTHAFLFTFYRNYFNERSDVYFKNRKRFSMLSIQEVKAALGVVLKNSKRHFNINLGLS